MLKLALHPTTKLQVDHFIAQPSHAVLLTGATGIGKTCLAVYIAEQLLGLKAGKLASYAYVRRISPIDARAIGIEPIRELEHFLSLKVPGSAAIKRVILIEDSHLMGTEAQNALLKTLEEPPADTALFLTAPSAQSLLPTIQSRLQTITVVKPSKAELQAVLNGDNFDMIYAVCGGLPGLMHAMLTHDDHPLLTAVATARQLLGQSGYERLLQVDTLSKDKQLTHDTLTILQQMAHISLQTAAGPAAKRWQSILTISYEATEALNGSGNSKLVLTNALLKL